MCSGVLIWLFAHLSLHYSLYIHTRCYIGRPATVPCMGTRWVLSLSLSVFVSVFRSIHLLSIYPLIYPSLIHCSLFLVTKLPYPYICPCMTACVDFRCWLSYHTHTASSICVHISFCVYTIHTDSGKLISYIFLCRTVPVDIHASEYGGGGKSDASAVMQDMRV